MKTELDIESQKSPEQIEREIDAQRASIGNIVDQLESKFTPGQMIDQAWGMLQNNGSQFVTNLGTSVRNNPVPAVLTSVGLLWLMMGQNRPPVPQPTYRSGPDQDRAGEWADGLADSLGNAREHMHQTSDSLKHGYQSLKGKAAHMGENVGAAKENLRHTMHDASDRLSQSGQAMGQQFNQLLKEQPLMVAAAGIAIGAMLGAALPKTATEQRYLGRTSAGMVDKVKKQAREGYETVRDTVTKTTEQATGQGAQPTQATTSDESADLSKDWGRLDDGG